MFESNGAEPKRACEMLVSVPGDLTLSDVASTDQTGQHVGDETAAEFDHCGCQFGPYTAVAPIGQGGFGAVYLAENNAATLPRLRKVALKVSRQSLLNNRKRTWQAEVDALRSLSHSGIVSYLDSGVSKNGETWLAMEWVNGEHCNHALAAPKYGWREKVSAIVQVCDAIEYAHAHGILHRDLKPSNILMREDGSLVVVDFGLVQFISGGPDRTASLAPAGTPSFIAPEQVLRFMSEDPIPLTTAVDVFGLGATLYLLLSGKTPRTKLASSAECLTGTIKAAVPRLPNRDLPASLINVVDKALQFDPGQRYATVKEFRRDLQAVLDCRPTVAKPIGVLRRTVLSLQRQPIVATWGMISAVLTASLLVALVIVQVLRSEQQAQSDRDRQLVGKAINDVMAFYHEAESDPGVPAASLSELQSDFRTLIKRMGDPQSSSIDAGYHAAVAEYTLAEHQNLTGKYQEANDHLVAVIRQFEKLRAIGYEPKKVTFSLFHALNKLAFIQHKRLEYEKAANAFSQARHEIEQLLAQYPEDVVYMDCLAQVIRMQGKVCYYQKQLPRAIEFGKEAIEVASRLRDSDPDEPMHAKHFAGGLCDLGMSYIVVKNEELARQCFEKAVRAAEPMLELRPDDPHIAYEVFCVQQTFVEDKLRRGDCGGLSELSDRMSKCADLMIRQRPDVPAFVLAQEYASELPKRLLLNCNVCENPGAMLTGM